MCGIVGYYTKSSVVADPIVIENMLAAILHRGPDEQGYAIGNEWALGNVRLSIIDVKHGQQPMRSDDGRYVLVFNGEIFNYLELRQELENQGSTFRTLSDTEVLFCGLITAGSDFISKLNGQFAFAFYDTFSNQLLMARDRFGERPLFYTHFHGGIIFGSEIKSFLFYPGFSVSLDPEVVQDIINGWTPLPGDTVFKGIKSIETGMYAQWDGKDFQQRYYQNLTEEALDTSRHNISLDDAIELTRNAIERSVQLRLRADMEVVAYVSGGLDSTIIAQLAQRNIDTRLKTYSIRFADQSFDEGSYQFEVVQQLRSEHHEVEVDDHSFFDAIHDVVYHAETSLYRLAPVPMFLLARLVRQNGNKVVLTGEGADDFFLGYDIFRETLMRQKWENPAYPDNKKLNDLKHLYPYLDHFQGKHAVTQLGYLSSKSGDMDSLLYGHRLRHIAGNLGTRLVQPDVKYGANAYAYRLKQRLLERHPRIETKTALEKTQIVEHETLLTGYLLSSQGDRMSSAHSIEARYPFLDPDVIRLSYHLPVELMLKQGIDEKYVLKQAFRSLLPDIVFNRLKYPYRSPDAGLLLGDRGRSLLPTSDDVKDTGVFDPGMVERFLGHLDPKRMGQSESQALIILTTTCMLHNQFCCNLRKTGVLPNLIIVYDYRTSN